MSYTPQAGDRVRYAEWDQDRWVDVLFIDGDVFYGRNEFNHGGTYGTYGEWSKVEESVPLPERWINIYPLGQVTSFNFTRAEADSNKAADRIAVLHIWTDDDGDHPEIERVNS